jgi:putative ubiquitin-RnfH superfamily antitoxin RatB of RatAB toxin-antitoxin module
MQEKIGVEVVFATADRQQLVAITLPRGATVAEAISESSLVRLFPNDNLDDLRVGVWGRLVHRNRVLSDGDRVELYRPLEIDPRDARRQLAMMGRTMGGGSTD